MPHRPAGPAGCWIAGMTAFGFPRTAKMQQATGTITTPTGRQAISLTISSPTR